MRHWRSFHDGSSRLTKYTGKECELRQRKKRGKVVWERKPCLQHGFNDWIEIEGDSVTIAFDADQKKRLTGFTMVWETVDAPSPPVIFPTGSGMSQSRGSTLKTLRITFSANCRRRAKNNETSVGQRARRPMGIAQTRSHRDKLEPERTEEQAPPSVQHLARSSQL